jgi:hypothetical protein
MSRKDYFVKVQVVDIAADRAEQSSVINYSTNRGRENLDRLIFKCLNTGKGVTIELDRTEQPGS